MNYLGIDLHKRESQVAVVDHDGEIQREVRVENANLDALAEEYAGNEAAIEATGNYFTVYDALDEHLDVVLVNPLKTRWIAEADQKTDRVDAKKLAQLLRVDMVAESYVPPDELRKGRALARGRKKFVEKRTDCKNEVHAILDQNGINHEGSLWTDKGREFLRELALEEPAQLLLDQWLELIDDLSEKITRLDREVERVAASHEETQLLMSVPGISSFSGLMIHTEIGEVDRFDQANQVVSYAGLDPTVRESGDSRTEGSISKRGNGYLRWILVQCANTAVHNCKDPYLSEFYWRLREAKDKPHRVAIVATARKLLVSIYHMLTRKEVYDPPGVSS